jgi:hypothetical protein
MNRLTTNASLFGAALAATFAFYACGDDSSSGPSGDSGTYTSTETNSSSYQMLIDENSQTMHLSGSGDFENMCLVKGNTVEWGQVKVTSGERLAQYKFVGDTLAILWLDNEEGEYEDYGEMFVGGTAGNIYGSWSSIPCMYHDRGRDSRTICDSDFEGVQTTLTISNGSFSKTTTKTTSQASASDYPTSLFRIHLFTYLATGSKGDIPTAGDIFGHSFDQVPTAEALAMLGIVSTDISLTGESFTYAGIPVTVEIQKAFKMDDDNKAAIVNVTANGVTCTGIREEFEEISREYCTTENINLFDTDSDTDANGNKYYYAYDYLNKNIDEFRTCIQTILPVTPAQ